MMEVLGEQAMVTLAFSLVLVIAFLTTAALRAPGTPVRASAFLNLHRGRLQRGMFAAIGAMLVLAVARTWLIGHGQAREGLVDESEAHSRFGLQMMRYIFLTAPVQLLEIAVMILALHWFRAVGLTSVVGALSIVTMIAVGLGIVVYVSPYNLWCEANQAACAAEIVLDSLATSIPVALCFGLAAGLPLSHSKQ